MKKYEIFFSIIKVPFDFLIIFVSFFIAREIRLVTDLIPGIQLQVQSISLSELFVFALGGAILYTLIFAFHKLYFIKVTSSKIQEFFEVLQYSLYWFLFFGVIVYLGKGFIYSTEIPRLILLFTLIIGSTGVILSRIFLNNFQYYLLSKGFLEKKKIILVNNKNYSEIKNILKDLKKSNIYKIVGYINKTEVPELKKLTYLGKIKEIQALFEQKNCDEVLAIDSSFSKKELSKLWELTRIFGIRYRYITNNFDITKSNTTLGLIHNIPVIEINASPLDNWGKVIKRISDIIMSTALLILLFPLLIIIGILIKIEDPKGPIIYKNKRTGQKGKIFSLYKFRYMKWKYCIKDAYNISAKNDSALKYEKELIKKFSSRKGPLYKIKNDPRKTRVGNFIEKYSLDELPQLYNVLLGNMSLVGPRPHQPREVEKYSLEQKRLLTIKPGITGMAQVNGRENNDFSHEANLDIFYIENWNFLLDFKILLKTVSVVLKRK